MNKFGDETRANQFDRWVGKLQTEKTIELGVGDSILDIGCGVGEFTKLFTNRFKRVVGIDPAEDFIKEAQRITDGIEYIVGWGENFSLDEKFDTINMTNLLEHVDNPVTVLKNCKKHLAEDGVIIAQVPNCNSITRRLGVLMEIIPNIEDISDKERNYYGHKRVFTIDSLIHTGLDAGLHVTQIGGILYKPLPNEMLLEICRKQGKEWTSKFLKALDKFAENRADECAQIYIVCR